MNIDSWLLHFRRNRQNRREPDWQAPIVLTPDVVAPLVRSLEQFQLGDGGGPAKLIAWNAERFLSTNKAMRDVVGLWFEEEREHSRLLCAAVARFGGNPIQGHWSFTAFCLARRWFGVSFELTVLLLTEIVSTVYYRLMRRHGADTALGAMCLLIIRDENGHVAFHCDRLASLAHQRKRRYGKLWRLRFRLLGFGAATMLWVNHARALRALGATRAEFYHEVGLGVSRFIANLQLKLAAGRAPSRSAVATAQPVRAAQVSSL